MIEIMLDITEKNIKIYEENEEIKKINGLKISRKIGPDKNNESKFKGYIVLSFSESNKERILKQIERYENER